MLVRDYNRPPSRLQLLLGRSIDGRWGEEGERRRGLVDQQHITGWRRAKGDHQITFPKWLFKIISQTEVYIHLFVSGGWGVVWLLLIG